MFFFPLFICLVHVLVYNQKTSIAGTPSLTDSAQTASSFTPQRSPNWTFWPKVLGRSCPGCPALARSGPGSDSGNATGPGSLAIGAISGNAANECLVPLKFFKSTFLQLNPCFIRGHHSIMNGPFQSRTFSFF